MNREPETAVADVLPLSPLQEGLLFHAVYDRGHSDVYGVQLVATLEGEVDALRLRAAAHALMQRHPNLRACFRHEGLSRSVQVIPRDSPLAWQELDWSSFSDKDERLQTWLDDDRARVFDVTAPPLLRWTLIRTDPARWRLVLTHHHLLFDGWSTPILFRELFALYAHEGDAARLPPVTPYREYLAWVSRQDQTASRDAWRAALAGLESGTTLAAPSPPPSLGALSEVNVDLPEALCTALVARGRTDGWTLNTMVQGAWALVLGYLTSRSDVVFGTTVAGRPPELPGSETMVGLFINTIPVRIRWQPGERVADVLTRSQMEQVSLVPHHYMSLPAIHRLADAGNLFDTLVVFENYPVLHGPSAARDRVEALRVESVRGRDATHYALSVIVVPGRQLRVRVSFREDVLAKTWVLEVIDRFRSALQAIAARPEGRVADVVLLDDRESHRVLVEWNGTTHPLPETDLASRVRVRAAVTPDAVAVVHGGAHVSYGAVVAAADRVASALEAAGVRSGDAVGVALEPSIDFVVALVGVLIRRALYLPLDLQYPVDRLRFMLHDVRPTCVVATRRCPHAALEGQVCVWIENMGVEAGLTPCASQASPSAPGDTAAYVMYTSGSTGQPKGIVATQRGIIRLVSAVAANQAIAVTSRDRVAQMASVSFDAATYEIWGPLVNGGTIVIVDRDTSLAPADLEAVLRDQQVTALFMTPALFEHVVRDRRDALAIVTRVLVGGDVVDAATVRSVVTDRRTVVNGYGPTETTTFAVAHEVLESSPPASRIPIGRPIANTRAYVLDGCLRPVLPGVTGELYVSGDGLARGYWNRAAQTAERFVANPFEGTGRRMYRTGDLVQWSADGVLDFIGRTDGQVKVRGFRVELSEIESVLKRQPGVGEAVAIVRDDGQGRKQLVAYVVSDAGDVDTTAVRGALARTLPEYMLPAAVVRIPRLPLTANGKVDRRALPAPDFSAHQAAFRAPRTPAEQQLCAAAADLLHLANVGLDDNFFTLGGDSILSIQLVSRVRKGGFRLTPRDVFEQPTFEHLAQRAEGGAAAAPVRASSVEPLICLEASERQMLQGKYPGFEEVLPLTPLQEGLLFHALYEPIGPDVYTAQMMWKLGAQVNRNALRCAADALLARYPNLRAAFVADGVARPVQVVCHSLHSPWVDLDWSAERPEARERRFAEWVEDDRATRFDVGAPPLLRFTLIRFDDRSSRLVLTYHHVLFDGWSVPLLIREFAALYEAGGDTSKLPPVTHFRTYLGWLAGQDRAAAQDAWRAVLAGVDEGTRLAPQAARHAHAPPDVVHVSLSPEITGGLTARARARGGTLNTLVQAAWGMLLRQVTGQDDVLFGATVSGRPPDIPDVETMVGFFINTIPVRLRMSARDTADEVIAQVHTQHTALLPHQHLALTEIQRLLNVGELFDTLVVFENYPNAQAAGGAASAQDIVAIGGRAADHYALSVTVTPGAELALHLAYRTDCFARETIEAIGARLRHVLESLGADVHARIGTMDIGDHTALVPDAAEPGRTAAPPLWDRVRAHAARLPDATAIECGARQISYQDLVRRVHQLAWALCARSVGPETIVAVCLPTGVEAIVAVLGVRAAGATYLIVDPSWPRERVRAVLADAVPRVVLIGHTSVADFAIAEGTAIVLLDAEWSAFEGFPAEVPPPAVGHERGAAYILYTSGSSGRPKGVVIEDRALHAYLDWASKRYASSGRGAPVNTPLAFDATITSVFLPLMAGQRVAILPEHDQVEALAALLTGEGSEALVKLTPAHLQALDALIDEAAVVRAGRFVVGGEQLPAALAERWRHRVTLVNEYGPTETVVGCAVYDVRVPPNGLVPIGRPTPGTRLFVCDQDLRPSPTGVRGELYIAGCQLGRGYLNQPAETATRFVANPFGPPGTRLYRTGDLVYRRPDGEMVFVGRADRQVKIRGHRMELGEIEAVLAALPSVSAAVAASRAGTSTDAQLVAYIVPSSNGCDVDELRAAVARALPAYMVPSAFVLVERLPVTRSGKVDRSALPAPETALTTEVHRPPRTRAEMLLCELSSELLRVERVGIGDSFFALGGDSILSIQLVSRARKAGLRLTPRDVFEHPVIEALAAVAEPADEPATAATPPDVDALSALHARVSDGETLDAHTALRLIEELRELRDRERTPAPDIEMPLTPVMKWLMEYGGVSAPLYQSQWLQLPVGATASQVAQTLQAIVDRHEALRCRLMRSTAGDWCLVAAAPGAIRTDGRVQHVDLSRLDASARERRRREMARVTVEGLAPEAGVMWQAAWFDCGPAVSGQLLLVIHHLAIDAVSWRILRPELEEAWEAARAGRPPSIVPETPFHEWAEHLVIEARRPERITELGYWQSVLEDVSPLVHGTLDPARDTQGSAGRFTLTLPPPVAEAVLTRLPALYHGDVDDVLLTALAMAVARTRRRWDAGARGTAVLVDVEGHGRHDFGDSGLDLTSTVGWFTTIAPYRLQLDGLDRDTPDSRSFDAALKAMKEQRRRIPDRGAGFGLLRYLNPVTAPVLAQYAPPQLGFNYLGRITMSGADEWASASSSHGAPEGLEAMAPLTHGIEVNAVALDRPDGLHLRATWTWAPSLLRDSSAHELAEEWFRCLARLSEHAASPHAGGWTPSDFPLVDLSGDEIEVIEERWGATAFEDVLPLTPLQHGLLFHSVYDPAAIDAYTSQLTLRLEGTLDVHVVQETVRALIRRHPALRAAFVHEGLRRPVQVIAKDPPLRWTVIDFTQDDADREERFARRLAAERAQRFDLTRPPLARWTLCRYDAQHWRLVITYHHIALDGWSVSVLARELAALLDQDSPAALPAAPAYRNYLRWLVSQDVAAARTAWANTLAGLERGTSVAAPTERTVPAERTVGSPFKAVHRLLPETVTSDVKRQMRSGGWTLGTLVQAAWALLLRQLTGRDDVVFGLTVAGRPPEIADSDRMVGLFINTVPLRPHVRPSETISELLTRMQSQHALFMAHQHVSLADIQRAVGVGDLFDTLVVVENYSAGHMTDESGATPGRVRVTPMGGHASDHYPLSLAVVPGRRLLLRLTFDPGVFDERSIEALAERLAYVLETLGSSPSARVGELSLLPPIEREKVLNEWNRTQPAGEAPTLLKSVWDHARRTPNAVAVEFEGQTLTYAEVTLLADRLACLLTTHGVREETLVAVCLPPGLQLVVALLGIQRAGAGYLPVDRAWPCERIAAICAEAAPIVTLTRSDLAARLPKSRPVVCLDDDWDAIRGCEPLSDAVARRGRATAYVLYTSGSTGRPKGVVVEDDALAAYLRWACRQYAAADGTGAPVNTPVGFDATVTSLYLPLMAGQRVILLPDDAPIERLAATVTSRGPLTLVKLTPAHLHALELLLGAGAASTRARRFVVGGEALSAAVANFWQPWVTIVNEYGPTEAVVGCCTFEMDSPMHSGSAIPIGSPAPGTQVYVLDSQLSPVGEGVVGELYIAGRQLARGYFRQPGLTAARFLANPYGRPGTRLYRTGDLARWRADGALDYIGRADRQVKLRGYRIEPGEIEALLHAQPGVANAVAVVREDLPGDKRLVAYVTCADGASLDGAGLRDAVAQRVPDYMVPHAVVTLAALPLTRNGKVDHSALPAPGASARSVPLERPSSLTEEQLCGLFADVLGIDHVGVTDNFFSLGGDSIVSIQLVSRARKAGLEFRPRDVFQHPTVRELARIVDAGAPVAAVVIGDSVSAEAITPTPIMEWIAAKGTIDRFTQAQWIHVPPAAGLPRLTRALQRVIDRHDALRLAVTREASGGVHLDIRPAGAVRADMCLRRVVCDGMSSSDLDRTRHAESRAALRGLAPTQGVMVQAVWFDAGEAPGQLLLLIHHFAVDNVSWGVVLDDLHTAWLEDTDLTPADGTFARWAAWLSADSRTDARVGELPYWCNALEAVPPLFATGADAVPDVVGNAGSLVLTLPSDVTRAVLTRAPGLFHAEVNDVLLAAFALAVAYWRRSRGERSDVPIVVDVEGHGRGTPSADDRIDPSHIVGWLTTLFPVRLDVSAIALDDAWLGGKDLSRAIKTVKEQRRQIPGDGAGFGLLRYLNPDTRAVLEPLGGAQLGFNYLGRASGTEEGDWRRWQGAPVMAGTAAPDMPLPHLVDMNAVMVETSEGPELRAFWSWAPSVVAEADVRMLGEAWFHALGRIAERIDVAGAGGRTPSDLPLVALPQDEIEWLERVAPPFDDVWPLTPLQQGLLFHRAYAGAEQDVYNVQIVIGLAGAVNPERFELALQKLMVRHPNLRAVFVHEGLSQPVQVIPSSLRAEWSSVDFTCLPLSERQDAFDVWLADDRSRPLSVISNSPLAGTSPASPALRGALVRMSPLESRLVLTYHHVLMDGWSTPVLLRELAALYASGGDDSMLPRPTPYRNYLAWLTQQDFSAAETAWRSILTGVQDGTRVAVPAAHLPATVPATVDIQLSLELTEALKAQARVHGWTLNTLVQAAWGLVLARVTGRNDVVYGITVAGRSPEIGGIETMLGLFINTVPLRFVAQPDAVVSELVDQLQQEQARLLPYQHLSLPRIQRLADAGDLFDTLLVFENYPSALSAQAMPADTLTIRGIDARDATHYPVSVVVTPDRQLRVRIDYRPECVTRAFAQALGTRFELALEHLLQPTQRIGDIDLLIEAERTWLVERANDTARPVDDETMWTLFARQAAATPDRVAVICGHQHVTYAELERRATRMGGRLSARGIRTDSVVGICLDRSADMVVAVLGVLSSGAGYVPLEPSLPDERLHFIARDAGIRVAIASPSLATRLSSEIATLDIVAPDGDADWPGSNRAFPDSVLYVLYTSGSTGRPKGVAMAHRPIANLLQWHRATIAGDRTLQFASLGFDPSIHELFAAWLSGGVAFVAGDELRRDADALARFIREREIAKILVPVVLLNQLASIWQRDGVPPSLATVIVAGEQLVVGDVLRDVFGSRSDLRLHNHYGPTEAHVVTSYTLSETPPTWPAWPPIGAPIWNTSTHVLSESLRPVPVGTVGELYLGGRQLARGYVDRADLTACRFVANPFGPPGARLYRTGDLVKWDADDQLIFVGRVDGQIKIRGFRVELGEIEAALREQPGVTDAVVVAHDDPSVGKRLIAYIVAGAHVDVPGVRAALLHTLPDYMVPATIVPLDQLPLNAHDKVDRRALPIVAPAAESMAPRMPATTVEQILCKVMADVLSLAHVSPDDNFFDLGGDSLVAMDLISRIKGDLGFELSVRNLFEAPTPSGLARSTRLEPFDVILPLRPSGDRGGVFCVHPQSGLGWCYWPLANNIPAAHPLYGIQCTGITDDAPLPSTLLAMAAEYVDQMVAVQPDGPYHLLGWSFGGLVAHAMATLLQSRGRSVGVLALLDTHLLRIYEEMGPDALPPTPRSFRSIPGGFVARLRARAANNVRLMSGFMPTVFDGDLVLFLAGEHDGVDPESTGRVWPSSIWNSYTSGDVRLHRVAATHLDMLRPTTAAEIGRVLTSELSRFAETVSASALS